MLGDYLKKVRKAKKFTLRQVQDETGIANAHLSQLENGKIGKPSQSLLQTLAEYYSIDFNVLLKKAGYVNDSTDDDIQLDFRKYGIQNILKVVKSTDLKHFADQRRAEEIIPEVIQRLITATTNVELIILPTGDSIYRSGWDGKVVYNESYNHPFIPKGISLWEISREMDFQTKAEKDFKKRTENPLGEKITEGTFIFVTPRRWEGKNDWANAKRDTTDWANVRVIDADDLELWLGIAPAVGIWLARELGLRTENATSLFTFWDEWWHSTDPPIDQNLLLKTQIKSKSRLDSFLSNPIGSKIHLHAHEIEIAIAYLAAIILTEKPNLQINHWSRAVIVEDKVEFRTLSAPGNQLILIPTFDGASIGKAIQNGHKVFIPTTRESDSTSDSLSITRLPLKAIEEQLILEGGKTTQEAHRIAIKTHGSLSILRRLLADEVEVSRPEWTKQNVGSQLIPLLFAGSWDSSNKIDKKIMGMLSNVPYEEFEMTIQELCSSPNPACKKIGSIYTLTSQEYVYSYLRDYITQSNIERIESVIMKIFKEIHPKYKIPKNDRIPYQVFQTNQTQCSDVLRKGLSISLGLLSIQPPVQLPEASNYVHSILYSLYKEEFSWEFWATLSDVLPIFIEAAPDQFLDSIETILDKEESNFSEFFYQTTPFGRCDYAFFLWGLECLAWNQKYLGRVTYILCRLADLEDPESNWMNKPSNSLQSIFLLWFPQTSASQEERFEILNSLIEKFPDQSWNLLTRLILSHHSPTSSNYLPKYRDWADSHSNNVSNNEIITGIKFVSGCLIDLVDYDPLRWKDILELLSKIPLEQIRLEFVEKLCHFDITKIDEPTKVIIWEKIQSELFHHKKFSEAEWSLDKKTIKKLEEAYSHFEPDNLISRWKSIFCYYASHPDCVTEKHDHNLQKVLTEKLQHKATLEIFKALDIKGLSDLSQSAKEPRLVGINAAQIKDLIEDDYNFIINFDDRNDSRLQEFLKGFIRQRYHDKGNNWAKELIDKREEITAERLTLILSALPWSNITWELLNKCEEEVIEEYWKSYPPTAPLENKDDVPKLLDYLLKFKRPFVAFQCLVNLSHSSNISKVSTEMIKTNLDGLIEADFSSKDWVSISDHFKYGLEKILEILKKRPDVDYEYLAKIEWNFMTIFKFDDKPDNMVKLVNTQPNVFTELITMTYKKDDGTESEENSNKALAERGFSLLWNYNRVPGLKNDGTLDDKYLLDWIDTVRKQCALKDRLKAADLTIGRILAYTPNDPDDGCWPHKIVRDILEHYMSPEIEDGLYSGIYNKRGAFGRDYYEGGKQERELASQYRKWAENCDGKWTRISKVLRDIEKGYSHEAKREDIWVEQRQQLIE